MQLSFQNIIELLIRFLGIPRKAFGTIVIKLQHGEPKHVVFEESFDLESLNLSKLDLKETTMFTKFGAKNEKDSESSSIISEVELDDKHEIKKESKLKKKQVVEEKEEEKKEEEVNA